MASLISSPSSAAFSIIIIFLSLQLYFTSPAHSLTCDQKFNNNKIYANCTSLPSLSSILHYTFNATNSSLSVAFLASPVNPDGWVAWGINPNGTGMAGTQALVALKSSRNLVVKTFNLISYGSIKEEKLSFDVWDLGVESLNGTTAIFASVKIPAGADKVNHIWQVGGTVTNGSPGKHEFNPPNLAAKQSLQLTGSAAPSPGSTSAPGGSPGSGNSSSGGYSYSYRRREMKFGVYAGLLVIVAGFNIWL